MLDSRAQREKILGTFSLVLHLKIPVIKGFLSTLKFSVRSNKVGNPFLVLWVAAKLPHNIFSSEPGGSGASRQFCCNPEYNTVWEISIGTGVMSEFSDIKQNIVF